MVRVTYPRTANNDKELTVVRGELLEVMDDTRKWWKARNSRNQMGHVPHTIVAPYSPEDDIYGERYREEAEARKRSESPRGTSNGASSASADWVRKKHIGKKGEFRYF